MIKLCTYLSFKGEFPLGNIKLWEEILVEVKSEISEKAFNTWFQNSSLDTTEDSLFINVANEFAADWVRKNYSMILQSAAEKILNKKIEIIITSKKEEESINTIV